MTTEPPTDAIRECITFTEGVSDDFAVEHIIHPARAELQALLDALVEKTRLVGFYADQIPELLEALNKANVIIKFREEEMGGCPACGRMAEMDDADEEMYVKTIVEKNARIAELESEVTDLASKLTYKQIQVAEILENIPSAVEWARNKYLDNGEQL